MLVLTCDTSLKRGSVGLVSLSSQDHLKTCGELVCQPAAEMLVPTIDKLLKQHHVPLADVQLYVINQGPGSFTGLRIGLAVLKTFAHVFQKPLVGLSTLETMAYDLIISKRSQRAEIMPLLHASADEFYAAIFANRLNKRGLPAPKVNAGLFDKSTVLKMASHNRTLYGAGTTALAESSIDTLNTQQFPNQPKAWSMAKLGLIYLTLNQRLLTNDSQPEYLRLSEPERKSGRVVHLTNL